MSIGKRTHEIFISMRCCGEKVEETFVGTPHAQTVSQEGWRNHRQQSSGVKTVFLPDLTCRNCFIRRHRLNPFHNVEVTSFSPS